MVVVNASIPLVSSRCSKSHRIPVNSHRTTVIYCSEHEAIVVALDCQQYVHGLPYGWKIWRELNLADCSIWSCAKAGALASSVKSNTLEMELTIDSGCNHCTCHVIGLPLRECLLRVL